MQYIVVVRNKSLINKWILLWYVEVLVSVSPFRKISRAAQVTNLNPHTHLFFHISVVTYMYSGGHMGMTECILQCPGNFKTFHDLPLWLLPPGWDGTSRSFVTTPTMMGCYFKTFSVLWAKSVCPNPCLPPPPTPPNTHTCTHNHKSHIT